jgi:ribosome maturation factor RimP
MADGLKERLTGLLTQEAESRGFDLVLLETAGTRRNPLVRVYLDHENGITIDQIAEANAWIKDLLDPLSQMENGYTLEVSSPGIERPLVKPADFVRFSGSSASVSVSPKVDGHTHFTGIIQGVEGDDVLLDVDGTTVRIPHASIARARLRVEFDFSKEGTADDGL